MIPINGKPVIAWILEDLVKKKLNNVIIVLREEDAHLDNFLQRTFSNKMELQLVRLQESQSILHSIKAGLDTIVQNGLVRIILGDTLIQDAYESKDDFIYINEVENSARWCLAQTDSKGYVQHYIEKQRISGKPLKALCGYYHLHDSRLITDCVDRAIANGQRQISDALAVYQQERAIQARWVKKWFDFGNLDNLLTAKQQLLQSRYFNSLSIDPILNTITKVSELDEKLRNELNWYESLPDKLKVLTPRIISKEERKGKLHLVQEYYGYPTLAELFLYSDLILENWTTILQKLSAVHHEFSKYRQDISQNDLSYIYLEKTFDRLSALANQDTSWESLLQEDHITINGKEYLGLQKLKSFIAEAARDLSENGHGAIIHGDFCFSNILYDYNNQIVRLIDPRGSFGSIGIYGDPRYDMAKLRHSFVGLYDYIVSDLFEIQTDDNRFEYKLYNNALATQTSVVFDNMVVDLGYDPAEIKFIEALLFLSMLPLHQDKPDRQKAMFLTGLSRLNELSHANHPIL